MSTLFNHTVVPQNSLISPVESLASELESAFLSLEGIIANSEKILPNYAKVIGELLLLNIKQHGFEKQYTQAYSITDTTQSIVLDAIPTSVTSVSYFDSLASATVYLTQKSPAQVFDDANQYKIIGKNLHLSGYLENITIQVVYDGIVPLLSEMYGYSNILQNSDNTYFRTPALSANTVEITYDSDVQSSVTEKFKDGIVANDNIFLIGKQFDDELVIVPYNSFTISTTTVTFDTAYDTNQIEEVAVFICNIDLATLVTSLYTDYVSHDHDSNGVAPSISHTDIVDNYKDSETIYYKDVQLPNYPHPQYLNREGYNSSVPEAYHNAMLGDILLSSTIDNLDQNHRTLAKNSYKILFADPNSGSSLGYNSALGIVQLTAGASLSGLDISFSTNSTGLSLNNTTKFSEDADKTYIIAKDNILDLTADDIANKSEMRADSFVSRDESSFAGVAADYLKIGNITYTSVGTGIEVTSLDPDSVTYEVPLNMDEAYASDLTVDNINLNPNATITIDATNTLKNEAGKFVFDTDTDVKFKSSGIHTGMSLGGSAAADSFNLYTASSDGSVRSSVDGDVYAEVPQGAAVRFLKPTGNMITKDGVTYSFGASAPGATTIASLKDWIRSDLYAGILDGDSLQVKAATDKNRNGVRIGPTTRISAVGSNADCPEGITVLESASDFHFTAPLSTEVDCNSLSYQSVNVGAAQVFGKLSVEDAIYSSGNIVSSDTVVAAELTVSGSAQMDTLSVLSGATLSGGLLVLGGIKTNGDFTASGSVTANGSLEGNTLTVENSGEFGGSLTVGGQVTLRSNLTIDGAIYTESGFSTTGDVSCGKLTAQDIVASSADFSGGLSVNGDTTLSGPTQVKGSMDIVGTTNISGAMTVSQDLTAKSGYIIDSFTVEGRLTSYNTVSLEGKNISIGVEGSTIQLNGNLQFNNQTLTISGDTKILKNLDVFGNTTLSDDATIKGTLTVTEVEVEASVHIAGEITANTGTFDQRVMFLSGIETQGTSVITRAEIGEVVSEEITTDDLFVKGDITTGPSSTIQANELSVKTFNQIDATSSNSFNGEVTFSNTVRASEIIIGNDDIKTTRNTSGVFLSDNTLRMGNNSVINAVKILAGKGAPRDGDEDRTGGFAFQSSNSLGTVDGDTGMFATVGSNSGLDESDLEFYIDGNKKGVHFSAPVEFDTALPGVHDKSIITMDVLKDIVQTIRDEVAQATLNAASQAYPIGTIYKNSIDSSNPAALLGFGVWIPYGVGRTIVGAVSIWPGGQSVAGGLQAPSGFNLTSLGEIYGEYAHTLTTAELPTFRLKNGMMDNTRQSSLVYGNTTEDLPGQANGRVETSVGQAADQAQGYTSYIGNNQPHSNVQPSIVAQMWQRVG